MFKVFKHVSWFFKQEWKKYILMLILLLLLAFMTIIPGNLLGTSIDMIVGKSITRRTVIILFLCLLGVPIIRYFIDFSYHYLLNSTGQKLSYTLRKNYLDYLFSLDSKVYEQYTKGDLITRVTTDMDSITIAATSLLQELIYEPGVIIFTIGAMISINFKLTLASVFILPIAFTILSILRNRMRRYYKTHRKIYSNMTERVIESVEGVKVVRAYVRENRDLDELNEAILADIESWRKINHFEAVFNPFFEMIYWICYIIAFGFGTYLAINQVISLGNMVTFNIYLGMLYAPIINLGNITNTINNVMISDERFHEILNLKPEVHDEETSKDIFGFNKIEFNDVSFKYPFDKYNVINHITFTINKGETIGVVGKTGSGKSTLIRQLLREFNITEGNITIDGVNIEEFKISDIRDLVGYVPQSHMLFRKTATENIMVGNQQATPKLIKQAIRIADFEKDIPYLPSGLNTMVGESGNSLSGGQKQRLSIARAVVKNPEILILDDSLSAVDANTERNIISHLKEERKGKTNIIIAHRFSAIKDADRIIVLDNGTISAIGNHKELMENCKWYREQFIKQNYFGGEEKND